MIPLKQAAQVRVEYGDDNFFPSLYPVEAVIREEGATRVLLRAPTTTCKARDRRLQEVETDACCQPAAAACC
jgi:hypothetical protein